MKKAAPARAALCASDKVRPGPNSASPPANQPPPLERHWPLPVDKLFEPEVPAIELLRGHACGPGRIGDLMRAARRPW